jgi:hypothetical protein
LGDDQLAICRFVLQRKAGDELRLFLHSSKGGYAISMRFFSHFGLERRMDIAQSVFA